MVITREEFENWLEHPGTKALKIRIKQDISYMKEMLVLETEYDTMSRLQERIKTSNNLLEVTYEDVVND